MPVDEAFSNLQVYSLETKAIRGKFSWRDRMPDGILDKKFYTWHDNARYLPMIFKVTLNSHCTKELATPIKPFFYRRQLRNSASDGSNIQLS